MTEDQRLAEAAAAVRRRGPPPVRAALVLGSGLGGVARRLEAQQTIPYAEVPHFPPVLAPGHAGRMVFGRLAGWPLVVLMGRPHRYEGRSPAELARPIRLVRELGAELLILTNAAGGLHPSLAPGDLMAAADQLNLMGAAPPWRPAGAEAAVVGWRRSPGPVYDPRLLEAAGRAARRADAPLRVGVYAAVTGPNYETRAEYRMLRRLGADAVGMSTAPEALAAAACGLRTLALSVVTNAAAPDAARRVSSDEVLAAAAAAQERLGRLLEQLAVELARGA